MADRLSEYKVPFQQIDMLMTRYMSHDNELNASAEAWVCEPLALLPVYMVVEKDPEQDKKIQAIKEAENARNLV